MQNVTSKESRKERRKKAWQELPPYEKVALVVSRLLVGAALIALVLEVLRKFDIAPIAIDFFVVFKGLLALGNGCIAVAYWRTQRSNAKKCIFQTVVWGVWAIVDVLF